jgi:hypothetical protein
MAAFYVAVIKRRRLFPFKPVQHDTCVRRQRYWTEKDWERERPSTSLHGLNNGRQIGLPSGDQGLLLNPFTS